MTHANISQDQILYDAKVMETMQPVTQPIML